jgi:hypothetical protein
MFLVFYKNVPCPHRKACKAFLKAMPTVGYSYKYRPILNLPMNFGHGNYFLYFCPAESCKGVSYGT